MDLDTWKQVFEEQQRQLELILSDCQGESNGLALLASKMSPLLEALHEDANAITQKSQNLSANDTKPEGEM